MIRIIFDKNPILVLIVQNFGVFSWFPIGSPKTTQTYAYFMVPGCFWLESYFGSIIAQNFDVFSWNMITRFPIGAPKTTQKYTYFIHPGCTKKLSFWLLRG